MTNDGYANGTSTSSYVNNQTIPTSGGVPVLTVSVSGNNDGIHYQSAIETFGVEYSNYLAYTYEAFTYTNIGGMVDVGVQYHRGEIGGYYAAGLLGANALGGKLGGKAYTYGFSNTERLFSHFEKHGGDIMKGLNRTDYNIKNYLDDANYVIRNGRYLPEMNGYVNFMGKGGKANYGFVGMTRDGKNITTFGVRNANGLRGL